VVEVHLHGGFGVAAALRNLLAEQGWQERPSSSQSSTQCEDFLNATSPLAMRVLAARRDAAWATHVKHLTDNATESASAAKALQRWNAWGQVLAQPPVLLLAGPPNAGKSTVFNAWLQERRVTASDHAGTTRDLVAAPCQLGTGAERFVVELVDSAGVWEEAKGVDLAAVAMSLEAITSAWRIVWLLDASTPPPATVLRAIASRSAEDLLVVNRSDLPAGWEPAELLPREFLRCDRGQLPQLLEKVEARLLRQLGPPPPIGQLVAMNAAEREELEALAARDSRRQP
jgi:tRNA U34 5-carboxymethylaminomethyl modifying GTPase MnmE/TrmE